MSGKQYTGIKGYVDIIGDEGYDEDDVTPAITTADVEEFEALVAPPVAVSATPEVSFSKVVKPLTSSSWNKGVSASPVKFLDDAKEALKSLCAPVVKYNGAFSKNNIALGESLQTILTKSDLKNVRDQSIAGKALLTISGALGEIQNMLNGSATLDNNNMNALLNSLPVIYNDPTGGNNISTPVNVGGAASKKPVIITGGAPVPDYIRKKYGEVLKNAIQAGNVQCVQKLCDIGVSTQGLFNLASQSNNPEIFRAILTAPPQRVVTQREEPTAGEPITIYGTKLVGAGETAKLQEANITLSTEMQQVLAEVKPQRGRNTPASR